MKNESNNEVVLSKRDFLFARRTPSKKSITPPWTKSIDNCIRCNHCIAACPENILILDANRLPAVNFDLGECTFCGECADVCKTSVFEENNNRNLVSPWNLAVNISDRCFLETQVYCRSCGDACPENAIKFILSVGAVTNIKIDQELCSGCGACVASCPRNAVSIQENPQQELS